MNLGAFRASCKELVCLFGALSHAVSRPFQELISRTLVRGRSEGGSNWRQLKILLTYNVENFENILRPSTGWVTGNLRDVVLFDRVRP